MIHPWVEVGVSRCVVQLQVGWHVWLCSPVAFLSPVVRTQSTCL